MPWRVRNELSNWINTSRTFKFDMSIIFYKRIKSFVERRPKRKVWEKKNFSLFRAKLRKFLKISLKKTTWKLGRSFVSAWFRFEWKTFFKPWKFFRSFLVGRPFPGSRKRIFFFSNEFRFLLRATWSALGDAHFHTNNLKTAFNCYRKASELESETLYSATREAFALTLLGRYEEAIRRFDQVLDRSPKYLLARKGSFSDRWEFSGRFFIVRGVEFRSKRFQAKAKLTFICRCNKSARTKMKRPFEASKKR